MQEENECREGGRRWYLNIKIPQFLILIYNFPLSFCLTFINGFILDGYALFLFTTSPTKRTFFLSLGKINRSQVAMCREEKLPQGQRRGIMWSNCLKGGMKVHPDVLQLEKERDIYIRWDANKLESSMCLEIGSGSDNDRGITLLQQIASFMFNFHLIPEEGRGSKEWLTVILIFQKNLCPPPKCQSLEISLFVIL